MVSLQALLLGSLCLTTNVLAGTLKYRATYLEQGSTKEITKTTQHFPDELLLKIIDNMSKWSNGKYKAEKDKKDKNLVVVQNSKTATKKSDTNNMLKDMHHVIAKGLSHPVKPGPKPIGNTKNRNME